MLDEACGYPVETKLIPDMYSSGTGTSLDSPEPPTELRLLLQYSLRVPQYEVEAIFPFQPSNLGSIYSLLVESFLLNVLTNNLSYSCSNLLT